MDLLGRWLLLGCSTVAGCYSRFPSIYNLNSADMVIFPIHSSYKMESKINNFNADMDRVIDEINAKECNDYGPVKICTMTVSIVLNQEVDLEAISTAIETVQVQEFINETLETELIIKTKGFHNSLTFGFKDDDNGSQKAIKVFSNGGLHIAGAKNLSEAITLGQFFETLLDIIFSNDIKMLDFSVDMINMTFQYSYHVDLMCVKNLIREKCGLMSNYDQDRHPGVICKFFSKHSCRTITIIFFRTGAMIMTGLKEPEEALEGHSFITQFMKDHKDALITEKDVCMPKKKRKTEKYDYGSFLILK